MKTLFLVLAMLLLGCIEDPPEPVACTQETKLCPDGSAVGRVPPDCDFQKCPKPAVSNVDVETDKFTYHSRQDMDINVTVYATKPTDAQIMVHGITARGRDRLKAKYNHTLVEGANMVGFEYRTPSCTGCSGITPGNYTITVEVLAEGINKTSEHTVEILQ